MIVENIKLSEWNEAVFMTAYVPSMPTYGEVKLRKAMLVCPGGAFVGHTESEMEAVALQLVAEGYCAFVLSYGIGVGLATLPAPLYDINKALRGIKERKNQWGIDSDEIYLLGFSSGALAVSLYGNVCQESWFVRDTNGSGEIHKPKAAILAYPLIDLIAFESQIAKQMPNQQVVLEMMFTALFNTPYPTHEQLTKWHPMDTVTPQTPPTWLWAWSEDKLVNSEPLIQYKAKLESCQVNVQLTFYPGQGHGNGLDFGGNRKMRFEWFETLELWLKSLK